MAGSDKTDAICGKFETKKLPIIVARNVKCDFVFQQSTYPNDAKKKTAPALIVFAAVLILFATALIVFSTALIVFETVLIVFSTVLIAFATALVVYSTFSATGVGWAQTNTGLRMTDNNNKLEQSGRPTRTLSFILSRE